MLMQALMLASLLGWGVIALFSPMALAGGPSEFLMTLVVGYPIAVAGCFVMSRRCERAGHQRAAAVWPTIFVALVVASGFAFHFYA